MWCLYSVNLCNGELKIPYKKEIQKNKQIKKLNEERKGKLKVKLAFFALLKRDLKTLFIYLFYVYLVTHKTLYNMNKSC